MNELDPVARGVLEALAEDASPGEVARRLRQARGMSLKRVAALLGDEVHLTTVGKLETGKMRLTLEWAYALGSVLQVPAATFHLPYDALNIAKVLPVYIGLEPVLKRLYSAAHHFTSYLTSRNDLFGIFVTGIHDIATEDGSGTVIVDPTRIELREGAVYAVANRADHVVVIGIYRATGGPARIVPWPSSEREVYQLPDASAEVIGEIVELQRVLVSRNG